MVNDKLREANNLKSKALNTRKVTVQKNPVSEKDVDALAATLSWVGAVVFYLVFVGSQNGAFSKVVSGVIGVPIAWFLGFVSYGIMKWLFAGIARSAENKRCKKEFRKKSAVAEAEARKLENQAADLGRLGDQLSRDVEVEIEEKTKEHRERSSLLVTSSEAVKTALRKLEALQPPKQIWESFVSAGR